jgi:hypothetical protein
LASGGLPPGLGPVRRWMQFLKVADRFLPVFRDLLISRCEISYLFLGKILIPADKIPAMM